MASRRSMDGASERMSARVAKAFQHWDTDGNGRVSREELIKVLADLGSFSETDVDTIMQAVDSDHSGSIDYSEFISWCFSGEAPYTIVRGFLKGGLCCLEGHPLEEFVPSVDGWCCEECGKDLCIGTHSLTCRECDGISWCVPCAAKLNDAGEDLRVERERAAEEEAINAAWEADETVQQTADRRDWKALLRNRLMRWPPPTRENLEDLLAGGVAGLSSNMALQATQRWLDKALPLEEYTATVELRRFLREHDLEALMPYMESGVIRRVEDLSPGAALEELARRLPLEAMKTLNAAGDAVADSRASELAESLGWHELVLDFSTQVAGLDREELAEMLFSTAGLSEDADRSTQDAVYRWLDHVIEAMTADRKRRRRGSVGVRDLLSARSTETSPPASPTSSSAAARARTPKTPEAARGRKTTTLNIAVPEGARPGEIVRVPYAGLFLPVRVPPRMKPGAPLQIVVPASAAAKMIGVGFNMGDLVEIDLPGTDVHGLVGRVVEFRIEQSRVAVEVAGRVLGFAASSIHTAAHIQPPGLSRHTSAPAAVHFGPSVSAVRAPAAAEAAADGPAVLVAAAPTNSTAVAAPPPPDLERSTSLAEACMGERFGAYPPFDLEKGPGTCAVCMDDKETFRLCDTDDCTCRLCKDCAAQFAKTMVEGAFYSMPFLRCPGCRARVQTCVWQPLVEDSVWQKYVKVGAALTEFRCGACHTSRNMWEESSSKLREAGVFRSLSAKTMDVVRASWQQFSRAQLEASVLWDELSQAFALPGDGKMKPPGIPDKINLKEVLGLIVDDERRLCLELAAVRAHPMIDTYCCHYKMCFGCKMRWHVGKTCEDIRRQEASKDVQFCPNCGVATVKSEGCNHMVCVCGTHWRWGANPKVKKLSEAISRRNYGEIKAIAPTEAIAMEALQSIAWDNVDIAPALPYLFDSSESGDLLAPSFMTEVWRIVSGMGRSNASLALQHILKRWPDGNDVSSLWAVALHSRRAVHAGYGSTLLDLEAVLRTLLAHGRGRTEFLSTMWGNFVENGIRVLKEKKLEIDHVLNIILSQAADPNDPDLFANILNATANANSEQLSVMTVLQVLLERMSASPRFVADVWRAVLGGTGVGITSLMLESYQIEEAFNLIMKHCGEDSDLLAAMLGPAAAKGHLSSMKTLLERGVDVNTDAGSSCAVLAVAAGAAQPEAVKLLLEAQASPAAGASPALHEALKHAMLLESIFDAYKPEDEKTIAVTFKDERRDESIGPVREFSWFARPQSFALALGGAGRGGAAGGGGGGDPRGRRASSPAPARAAPKARAGGGVPPAGAYRIGLVPEHPTSVASVRKRGKAERAGVRCGDVLVQIANDRGVQRKETDLAKGDPDRLIGRVQLPVTLYLQRGLKSQFAAVERDWQARTAVVSLLCAARADVVEPPVDVLDRTGLDHGRISPLLLAVRAGLASTVASLLQRGALPGAGADADEAAGAAAAAEAAREMTRALSIACRGGHKSVVDLLLDRRASPTLGIPGPLLEVARGLRTDDSLWDPEHFMLTPEARLQKCPLVNLDWQARIAIVKRLCIARADVNTGGDAAPSALYFAAEAGCVEAAQLLLSQGGVLRGPKLSALQRSAAGVRIDVVDMLLAAHASPDGPTGADDSAPLASPLAAAAAAPAPPKEETVDQRKTRKLQWSMRLEIAKRLLDARADIELCAVRAPTLAEVTEAKEKKKPGGATPSPLKAACIAGNTEMVDLLLDRGAAASGKCTALIECVGQAQLKPRDLEPGEEEVEYEEPRPPGWWNQIQRQNWVVAQWRKFRNDRVRRRERRQKRLKLESVIYEADTAARVAIIRRLCAQRADPACCEGEPLAEAARRGSGRLVTLLLTLGAPLDARLQWCPSCRQPALLSKPPDAAGAAEAEEKYKAGEKSNNIAVCACGASWPLAASPLHSLVAAAEDEQLWHCLSTAGADMETIHELWGFASTMLSNCGDRANPARAPAWGGKGAAKLLITLMERKAAVDSLLDRGGTLLRIACAVGQFEAVQTLLERKANPDSVAANRMLIEQEKVRGEMPLQTAVQCLRLTAGSTSDPALRVAANCGGGQKLPEDVEKLIIYEELKSCLKPEECRRIDPALEGRVLTWNEYREEHKDDEGLDGDAEEKKDKKLHEPLSAEEKKDKKLHEAWLKLEEELPDFQWVAEKKEGGRRGAGSPSPRPRRGSVSPARRGSAGGRDAPRRIGFPVLEVKNKGQADTAGISKGDLLVDVRGLHELPGTSARDTVDAGSAEKALQRHEPPLMLQFRGAPCTYTYDESPLKALVLTATEHDMLRVTALLVAPGKDTPEGGDACPVRCKAVMGRIIGSIDGSNILSLPSEEVRKRLDTKGLTLSFLSPAGEARAVRMARERRQCEVVERLCNASADPTAGVVGDPEGQPIIIAARAGHAGIVDILARASARLLSRALCAACESGSASTVDLLLNRQATPNSDGVGSASPLLLAARGATTTAQAAALDWKGFRQEQRSAVEGAFRVNEQATRFGICQRLLAQHADANSADADGQTPLHWAAATGDRQIVQLLLSLGCSAEPPGLRNCPLHVVCAALPHDSEAIISMLVKYHARVDSTDADGATPLLYVVRNFQPPAATDRGNPLTAAERHRLDFVRLLLRLGADPRRSSPESCLHAVVRLSAEGVSLPPRKPWPMLQEMLGLRMDPDCRDDERRSPLAVAIKCGAQDAVDLFLTSDFVLDLDTPLRAAAMNGDANLAKGLLERKADANAGAEADRRQAPLHLVAERGHRDVQSLLLDAGADVHWKDAEGKTPLHAVVTAGAERAAEAEAGADADAAAAEGPSIDDDCLAKMAEQLVYYGADVDVKFGADNWTSVLLAAQAGRPAVLRALLGKRADASCTIPSTGSSALHLVVGREGNVPADQMRQLVAELVRQGAKVDMRDKRKQTALHVAARAGWADALKTLTTKGAEVNCKDAEGRIALHAIAESNTTLDGAMQLMRWLVDPRTWDLDSAVDVDGRTPLHRAACVGQADFALALLQKEANASLRDKSGVTPLHLAAGLPEEKSVVLVAALLAARAEQYIRDDGGRQALDYAKEVSSTGAVVKLLSPAS